MPERVKNAYKKLETLKQAPDLIRFYIKQKFRDDIPWNSKLESYQTGDDQHHKIEKYLKGRSKGTNEGINIARLYNDNLEEVDNFKSSLKALTNQMMSQKHEQRQKITEMLNVKSKVKS